MYTLQNLPIDLPFDAIIAFCERNPIRTLSLFGSVLRDDFDVESDVDMLVEFEPDSRITYFDMATMEMELGDLIGRKIDLREAQELSRHFRQKVVDSALKLYERE